MKKDIKKVGSGELENKNFITSALRGGFNRFPNKYAALKNAFVGRKKNKKTGRQAAHYKCASCSKVFPSREIQVDHVNPVVDPEKGFINWDVYIDRMFCVVENLQALCKVCHKRKTADERRARAASKS